MEEERKGEKMVKVRVRAVKVTIGKQKLIAEYGSKVFH